MIGRTKPATPPKLTLKAAKTPRITPYAPITAPAEALLTLPINAEAAFLKPLRSRVPVTNMIKMKIAMLRFATKVDPRVSSKPPTPKLPTNAVTIAATMIIKIESSFKAKPTITTKTPNNLIKSISVSLKEFDLRLTLLFLQYLPAGEWNNVG
jgi:hypothetical protein